MKDALQRALEALQRAPWKNWRTDKAITAIQGATEMNPILKAIKLYRERALDPVKHCLVYSAVGCAHVDGMLCSMRTCDIKVKVEITPMAVKESK